nr:CD1871A family CXXC motif-containing protein [uncultured Butyricicoccus sp.]
MLNNRKSLFAPVLMVAGLGMMLWGYLDDEAAIVFKKAAIICLECIGVG